MDVDKLMEWFDRQIVIDRIEPELGIAWITFFASLGNSHLTGIEKARNDKAAIMAKIRAKLEEANTTAAEASKRFSNLTNYIQ